MLLRRDILSSSFSAAFVLEFLGLQLLLFLSSTNNVVFAKPACGGAGQRACCAVVDCWEESTSSFPFFKVNCPVGCDGDLNEVSLCGDEGTNCGDLSCSIGICLLPPSDDEKIRLKEQHYIDYDSPLIDATFIGTHNSYNNAQDGYPLPNNNINVFEQLEMGLRAINFDLHDVDIADDNIPRLCHDGYAEGWSCLPSDTTFLDGLQQIKGWLLNNPKEFVLLVIEDLMSSATTRQNAAEFIEIVLGNLVYTPSASNVELDGTTCPSVPLYSEDVTKGTLVAQGYQIIITTANDPKDCDSFFRQLVWDVTADAYTGGEGLSDNVGLMPRNTSKWIFVPEDRLFGQTFYPISYDYDMMLSRAEARNALKKGVNVIGLDFPRKVNRHTHMIWSWSQNQPKLSDCPDLDNCCAIQVSFPMLGLEINGINQWVASPCSDVVARFACQDKSTGIWSVTDGKGTFDDGQGMCESENKGDFAVPVNGNYKFQLDKAMIDATSPTLGAVELWVGYKLNNETGSWEAVKPPNIPPTCEILAFGEAESDCFGTVSTEIDFVATDQDGDTLTHEWGVNGDCEDIVTFSTTGEADSDPVFLSMPRPQRQCTITLTVSDGEATGTCSKSIEGRNPTGFFLSFFSAMMSRFCGWRS